MIERYQDKAGGWRWRMRNAENGKIVAVPGESFTRRQDLERAIAAFFIVAKADYFDFSGGLEL